MRSMTGYGAAQYTSERARLDVEIRTLNHKYFAWHFQAPVEWHAMELEFRSMAQDAIRRGDVRVMIRCQYTDPEWLRLELQPALVDALLQPLRDALEKWTRVWPVHINADGLLRIHTLAGVQWNTDAIRAELTEPLRATFARALDQVIATRSAEGQRIAETLERDLASIDDLLNDLETRWPAYLAQLKNIWSTRVHQWLQELQQAPHADRIWTEIALWLQRADAREELDRLKAHVQAFRAAMQTWPCGKRLDFIAQEMHREANTLLAKWQAAEGTERIVELKTRIDRLREQVQNIE